MNNAEILQATSLDLRSEIANGNTLGTPITITNFTDREEELYPTVEIVEFNVRTVS